MLLRNPALHIGGILSGISGAAQLSKPIRAGPTGLWPTMAACLIARHRCAPVPPRLLGYVQVQISKGKETGGSHSLSENAGIVLWFAYSARR